MNDYDISDYGIFGSAIDSTNSFLTQINSVSETINSCRTKIGDTSIFMGPIQENCVEEFSKLDTDFSVINENYGKIATYLKDAAIAYQNGDQAASNTVTSTGSSSLSSVDTSKYHSNPEAGFTVTTGNKTYEMSDSDRDFLYGIVAAESDQTYDDALAVISVILNRSESSQWVASFGSDPVGQCKGANQFEVYSTGAYRSYTGGNAPNTVQEAVNDALNGVRNNEYLSFRSNGSTGYSSNMITSTGNRYA